MAGAESSCRQLAKKKSHESCDNTCFEPTKPTCADHKIPSEPIVIKSNAFPEDYHRPQLNLYEECCKRSKGRFVDDSDRDCTINAVQNGDMRKNACSAECRPLSTMLHLEEWTERPRPKPTYKHSVMLDDNTVVGRVFPMKYRIRRIKNNCKDCGRQLQFRQMPTNSSNLMLLSDCCDITVYDNQKMDNMHRIRVTTISHNERFGKKVITQESETQLTKKVEPAVVEKPPSIIPLAVPVKPPKKGKKGKKGKKKKK